MPASTPVGDWHPFRLSTVAGMRLANVTAAVVSAIMVFGCAPAAVAQEQGASCSDAYLAVGGWPAVDRVPAGFEYVPTPGGIFPFERGGYNHGQDVGSTNVVNRVDDHFAQCPDNDVYISGHSYGAGVIHRAVATLDQRPYAGDVHVRLTGNPLHPGGVDDTWEGFTLMPGITFRGAGVQPQNLGTWIDICNPHDGICDMPPIWKPVSMAQNVLGYAFGGAHSYGPVPPVNTW